MVSFARCLVLAAAAAAATAPSVALAVGNIVGTVNAVMAGNDNWYGVRFYLNITNDQTLGQCNTSFVYTEPELDSGHKNKVAVFTAAYLAGKSVNFTVVSGRGGYCKLLEGIVY